MLHVYMTCTCTCLSFREFLVFSRSRKDRRFLFCTLVSALHEVRTSIHSGEGRVIGTRTKAAGRGAHNERG